MKLNKKGYEDCFWISIVYAKSTCSLRLPLWESLRQCNGCFFLVVDTGKTQPDELERKWTLVYLWGFNVIFIAEEKKGGRPHRMEKSWDFISCSEECGMIGAGFSGPKFTWCNARGYRHRI